MHNILIICLELFRFRCGFENIERKLKSYSGNISV